ncbi:hypothetical protein A2954_04875 [Candidatus Roizmanbacteria bacterium RIFCSPLOWO2_01_FULL_37_12]|uniref:Uncharacterized protein n=1 Tax=Candidatus Roizmanbacteria bacterium RIFCSPLOWO2_01_FULL_37_12 TaxID=1802056 RepID=A0A1F7I8V6_9BACT|nr:MAG: hypothetical protein A2768_01965 [Candidatus Roizmanbacteria bacterium RIFCSPHIGHO2_01_FULL_37_16]OGK23695.1 MAG: hypothetical protein A3D76_03915 [Candidatus Roizmanbacteria bacterium RIFCSPHIGHO2_02_FULL_37_9b]OGK39732.1 MAG: hypothetical protein A2954_04875 [Candidatus Roizmanbacteria bacterium RIFCSPLOWO2_01_FULL_37_12]
MINKKNSAFFIFQVGLIKTYSKPHYWITTIAIAVNVLFFYFFLLIQKTTWDAFLQSNTSFYIFMQIVLSILNAVFIGIALSMFFNVLEEKKKTSKASLLQTLGSLVFSAAATGCSVCSAFLLPALGIAASLTALPFGGLEIKFLSLLLLIYAIYESAKIVSGLCPVPKETIISNNKGKLELNISTKTLPQLTPLLVLILFVIFIYSLPKLPKIVRLNTQKNITAANQAAGTTSPETAALMKKINPPEGYELNATYGDIGPQMLELGVIDEQKFKDTYAQSGQPLSQEQLDILTKKSNKKIKITPENSYFLLNFFWAFGLANESKILTEGDMVNSGGIEGAGNFASTGGWTLTKGGNVMEYYSKKAIVPLTEDQEKLVNEVSSNVYRPCCGNSTAFPDCNHGMALLGIFELMAAQGATQSEMYEAGKYINSFWFPQNAFDAALYFKNKEKKEFEEVDGKTFLSNDVFSAFGAQNIKKWLVDNGVQEQPPAQGGGCGV